MNMTETPLTCARHPKVETVLRCGRCETPICPKCAVYTPVGVKCPDCGRNRSPLFAPSALQFTLAAVAAMLAGLAIGWLAGVLDIGLIVLFLYLPLGAAVGEIILRASGRKRGKMLEITAGTAFALGAFGGRILVAYIVMQGNPGLEKGVVDILIEAFQPFPTIAIVIALSATVSRIRYL